MRVVAVDDFRQLADATFHEEAVHAAELAASGADGFRREIPCDCDGFAEAREGPRPRGAIVISNFAARVFVSFIAATIWVIRIVQEATIGSADGQRCGNGKRREGSQGSR